MTSEPDRPILITGCDEGYVPYADALIRSIRAQAALDHLPIGLVDYGLTAESRRAFESRGFEVRSCDWPFDFPARAIWDNEKPHFRAFTGKPYLPDLFPEFDPLIWIDADAWLQSAEGVLGFLRALDNSDVVTVLEWDRGYEAWNRTDTIWAYQDRMMATNFGPEVATRQFARPIINSGVIALRRDAPLWRSWQNCLSRALGQEGRPLDETYLFEQCSINVAAYLETGTGHHLPATYNWSLYHAVPAWCPERRLYVDPNPPHDPIHVLHMTGDSKTRQHWVSVREKPGQRFATLFDYDNARQSALDQDGRITESDAAPDARPDRIETAAYQAPVERPIIVTASDEAYVGYLFGLVKSLRQHRDLDDIPIGVIDLGLSVQSRQALHNAGVGCVAGYWPLEFPAQADWERDRRGDMALTAKPYLRDFFRGHDAYLWIDADVWVQRPDGVTALLEALREAPAAAVQELDRSFTKYRTRPEIWTYHAGMVRINFGSEMADRMHLRPVINAGLFALRHDAPHWVLWQRASAQALDSLMPPYEDNRAFDQVALNVAIYQGDLPTALLPAPYNWTLIEARPFWCPRRRLYVEPSPPHEPIRNLHLTGPTKGQRFRVRVLGGESTFITTFDYESARDNAPKGD